MIQLVARERKIVEMLSEDSSRSVTEISEMLEVSPVTIRRDLKALFEKGVIVRTHGGAFPAFHPSILARQKSHVEEKERIAKAAAAMVEDGDNIILVAGTTTPLLVKYLLGKRDIHIVTNSTLLYTYARMNPALRLTVVGGEFRSAGEAMLGPNAVRGMEQFHADKAFLGSDGFSIENGITADVVEMAEVVKVAAAQSRQAVLLSDSSKYGRAGFAHIMGLENISSVITDTGLPESALAEFMEIGVGVRRV